MIDFPEYSLNKDLCLGILGLIAHRRAARSRFTCSNFLYIPRGLKFFDLVGICIP